MCMEHFKIYGVREFYDRMLSTYVGVQTKHLSLCNIILPKTGAYDWRLFFF